MKERSKGRKNIRLKKISISLLSILLTLAMVISLMPAQVVYAAVSVSNLRWDGNIARWDVTGEPSQYRVVLRVGNGANQVVVDNRDITDTYFDYSDYLLSGNNYTFYVNPFEGTTGQGFETGPSKEIDGSIGTISSVMINASTKTATWTAISGADGYDVWVKKGGSQIGFVRHTTDTAYDFSADVTEAGAGAYSVEVKAYKGASGNYMAQGQSESISVGGVVATVTLTFEANGGTGSMAAVTIGTGGDYTLPNECGFTAPSGKGFGGAWIIEGWDGSYDAGSTWQFSEDTIIKPVWKDLVSISFDLNGKIGTAPAAQMVVSGGKLKEPSSVPVVTGYTFGGWYKDTACTNEWDFATDIVTTGSGFLYAKWIPISYTVTYDTNKPVVAEGTVNGTTADSTHNYDEGAYLTQNGYTLDGYTFGGWNTAADGSGTAYADHAFVSNLSTTNDAIVTLYAQWLGEHTVKFDLNGKTGTAPMVQMVAEGGKAAVPAPVPAVTGYIVDSWYKEAACMNAWDFAADTVTTDTTLYAHWAPISYTVTYDANKPADATGIVSGTTPDSVHTYDTVAKLTRNGYTLTGYTFNGWNTAVDGSGNPYADEASVSNLTGKNGSTVTLYAHWKISTDGGTTPAPSPTPGSGEDVTPTPAPGSGDDVTPAPVLKEGEVYISPEDADIFVTPAKVSKETPVGVTVDGETVSLNLKYDYTNAVTYTGEKIAPDGELIKAKLDLSDIVSQVSANEGVKLTQEELFTVRYKISNNKDASRTKKASFYAKIKINKGVNKQMPKAEYRKLQKLVSAANKLLKANKCEFTINPKPITECNPEIIAKFKKDGSVKTAKKTGLLSGEKVYASLSKKTKLSKKMYTMEAPVTGADGTITVKLTGKKNYTGTAVVTIGK